MGCLSLRSLCAVQKSRQKIDIIMAANNSFDGTGGATGGAGGFDAAGSAVECGFITSVPASTHALRKVLALANTFMLLTAPKTWAEIVEIARSVCKPAVREAPTVGTVYTGSDDDEEHPVSIRAKKRKAHIVSRHQHDMGGVVNDESTVGTLMTAAIESVTAKSIEQGNVTIRRDVGTTVFGSRFQCPIDHCQKLSTPDAANAWYITNVDKTFEPPQSTEVWFRIRIEPMPELTEGDISEHDCWARAFSFEGCFYVASVESISPALSDEMGKLQMLPTVSFVNEDGSMKEVGPYDRQFTLDEVANPDGFVAKKTGVIPDQIWPMFREKFALALLEELGLLEVVRARTLSCK